ncbi:MAG: transcriptional repressor [bacterium]|nr:transcriptional repressor [bacterium]
MIPILQKKLKHSGYSITKARATVFSALQSTKPKTMRQLVESVDGVIDRASVYRTIALYEQLGIVKKIQHGWKYRLELGDDFAPHHHHLTCRVCGRVINFDEPEQFDEMLSIVAANNGFTPESHNLEITGMCSNCRLIK